MKKFFMAGMIFCLLLLSGCGENNKSAKQVKMVQFNSFINHMDGSLGASFYFLSEDGYISYVTFEYRFIESSRARGEIIKDAESFVGKLFIADWEKQK